MVGEEIFILIAAYMRLVASIVLLLFSAVVCIRTANRNREKIAEL